MKKNLLAGVIAGMFASSAFAFAPFVIKDVRVEGIQRTEAGTVFSYLPVKVGDSMDDDKASQAIKALFATGFFKDVRIEVDGDVLVVVVDERPAIAQIDFVGMKEFDKEQVKKGMKDVGLAESRIFSRALLDKATQELKRQYLSRGKYAANVTATVTPLERNRVGISFNVEEGDAAKIKKINIVGAKAVPEAELLQLFQLRTPGWFSWFSKNDQYSKQKLAADLETIRSYYLNRGYLEFSVESTQVSISPDKKDVFLTINLNEGERFQVSSVKLAGDLVLSDEELKPLVALKPGDVFSRERLNQTTKAIADKLGNYGYAFANVNAAPEVDKEKRQVAFTIFVDPGKRVYVRQINVTGNSRTRDEVIREEFRQMEGGWYDASKIQLSKQRVDKLNFFSDVSVETPAVPGSTDQVDVNMNVVEKPTGNIMLGAGFSSSEKLIMSGSIAQQNLFGSGKALSLQVNSSKVNQVYAMSYTNPYYTVDGISRGFDLYRRNVDPSSLSIGSYRTSTTGAGVRFGVPIAEKQTVFFGLSGEATRLTVYDSSPLRFKRFVHDYGDNSTTLLGNVGWSEDSKDSTIYPTSGTFRRATSEVGMPGGSLEYYRLNYQEQHFWPVSKSISLMLNGEFGVANGYGGKQLPFFKNFYAGGIGSVRGYDTASLGPRDLNSDGTQSDERTGGNRRLVGNAEVLFPVPGMGTDRSVRLAWFVDGGQIFTKGEKMALGDLRYSSGVAVSWVSPMGPLRFSLAKPLNEKPGDRTQVFQFQMGTTF